MAALLVSVMLLSALGVMGACLVVAALKAIGLSLAVRLRVNGPQSCPGASSGNRQMPGALWPHCGQMPSSPQLQDLRGGFSPPLRSA